MHPIPIALHGKLEYLHRKQLVGPRAESACARILEAQPDFETIDDRLVAIINENASLRSRFAKLLKFADTLAAAIAPHTGCKPRCDACCHISVGISGAEAQRIGLAIGITPVRQVSSNGDRSTLVDRYFGKPCPFLVDAECSIYEHRPVACKLHFTLDRDGYFCSTKIAPEDSIVPSVNLNGYWMAYGLIASQLDSSEGDIRQFFPDGKRTA